jgi:hypothetical protein
MKKETALRIVMRLYVRESKYFFKPGRRYSAHENTHASLLFTKILDRTLS